MRRVLSLVLIWCLIPYAQGQETGTDRLVVTFFNKVDAVRSPKILRTAQATNGFSVVKQYGRRLVLWFSHPVTVEQDGADVIALIDRVMGKGLVQLVELDYKVGISEADEKVGVSQMKMAVDDVIDVSAFDMPDYAANYNEVMGMAQEEPLWNIKDGEPYGIEAEPIWRITNSTPDVVVALVDSGLAAAALNVFLNVAPGYDFISDPDLALDGDERDEDATDPGDYGPDCPMSSWHGTRVASILAARHDYEGNLGMKGVAQNCTVMPVRVLGECRTGYASDVADAIVWAAGGEIVDVNTTETPAKIIMMAFSGMGACPGYLQSAVTQAINLGAILIAAAGNNGKDASMYFPGNCNGTLVIAASTRQGTLAPYSNFGRTVDIAAPGGDWANAIMALGVDQDGMNVNVQFGVGTSFAVPHVAGMASLAVSMHKLSDYKDVTSILMISHIMSSNREFTMLTCSRLETFLKKNIDASTKSYDRIANHSAYNSTMVSSQNCGINCCTCDDYESSSHGCCWSCDCYNGYYEDYFYYGGCSFSKEAVRCLPCLQSCPFGKFVKYCSGGPGQCEPCDACGAGQYMSQTCSLYGSGNDRTCTACQSCYGQTYLSGCGGVNAGSCLSCNTCNANEYKTGCGGTSEGTCVGCAACGTDQYRSGCGGSYAGDCYGCGVCPSNQYRSGCGGTSAGNCVGCPTCPAGYGKSGCTGTNPGTCTQCTAGKFSAGALDPCATCPAGKYSGTGAGSCISCQEGKYSAEGSASCTNCNAGKYQPGTGASTSDACLNCQAGTYSAVSGATQSSTCLQCGTGKYSTKIGATSIDTCTDCGTGTRSTALGAVSGLTCEQCSAGTYAGSTGLSLCTACSAGTVSAAAAASCTACTAGSSFTTTKISPCLPCTTTTCAAGNFISASCTTTADRVCTSCAAGKYSQSAGSAVCTTCPAGKYSASAGAAACTSCLAGTYSGATGATSIDTCAQCLEGTYSDVAGSTLCSDCPKGTYLSTKGAISSNACIKCAIGKFSDVFGLKSEYLCQPCGSGSHVGKYSDTTGATICQSCSSVQCDNNQFSKPCTATSNAACGNCDIDGTRPANADYSDKTNAACPWACNSGYFKNAAGTQCCVNCDNGLYNPQCAASKTACQACNN
jgi:hypothetical protein